MLFMAEDGADGSNKNSVHRLVEITSRAHQEELMAENKFVVKTVFHDENRDTLLREDYRETREKAQELKDLADFGYAGLFGKGQTKVTTEIIER